MWPDLDLDAFAVGLPVYVIGLSGEFRRSRCFWNFRIGGVCMRILGKDFYH